VLGQSVAAMAQLAEAFGLELVHVEDVRWIDYALLDRTGVLVLFTIGETPWTNEQRSLLPERLRAGELGLVAVHSATDSCASWPEYGSLVGARFNGHPWTATVELEVIGGDHPATAHLPPRWRWHDEVYQFRDLRPDATVLLQVPEEQLDLERPGVDRRAFGFPLSWCFTEGEGRVFSTSLGHFPEAWEDVTFLRHLRGGVEWALPTGSGNPARLG